MSGVRISIEGLDAIQRGFERAPEMTRSELLGAATESTLLIENWVKQLMPDVTGVTRNSVTSDAFSTPVGAMGVVSSTQPSAVFIELGTRPHMPPVDALVPWVQAVLGVSPDRVRQVAFLVARKIAKRGTPAQKPFERAAAATQGQVTRIFENAAARIAARLVEGGA